MIESWTDVSPARQRTLKSAVSTVVRLIGLPAGSVILSPAYLRERILCRSPKALGVCKDRKSNIFSDLSFIMRREGILDEAKTPISGPWVALKNRLPRKDPLAFQPRVILNGFARYCSLRGIMPDAVTSETLEAFEFQLTTRALTRDPRRLVGRIRGLWNRSAGTIAGWPAQRLERGRDPDQYILPPDRFPDSFKADLEVFGRRLAGTVLDDPFADLPDTGDDTGDQAPLLHMKPLRQTTIDLRKSHCRWAASALVATGVPIEDVVDLRSLVVPVERARTILRFLWDRAGRKPSAAGGHVAEVLRIVARYHARLPAKDIAQIKEWAKPVKLVYRGMTPKNEASIRAMTTPQHDKDMLQLPAAFMRAARELLPTHPLEAKTLAMRAVAIEILSRVPLRLGNLSGLRLDRHLQRPDPRRGAIEYIVIDILDETKNSRAICMPVSKATAAMIQEWITKFRPIVGSPDCVFLFPNHAGGNRPITPQGLRDAIKTAIAEHVGVDFTPHQFRHLAARTFLEAFPGHYEEVRQLLGHASIETTIRHYSGIESEASARRFDEVVLNRRRSLKNTKGRH